MTPSLPNISPDQLVQRAVMAHDRVLAALVVESGDLNEAAALLRAACSDSNITSSESELEAHVRSSANSRRVHEEISVVVSRSTSPELWLEVDRRRSKFEGRATLLVLSLAALESLNRFAPHLASVLAGRSWSASKGTASGLHVDDPQLRAAIEQARSARYSELYEAVDDRRANGLDDAVHNVLIALGDPTTDDRAMRRLGFMARALLIEALPTLAGHWPQGMSRATAVLEAFDVWLESEDEPPPKMPLDEGSGPSAPQAAVEAWALLSDVVRLLSSDYALEASEEIVDACLQGYAIIPGSTGRRALFDWWLNEVVPAAWSCRPPRRLDLARL